MYKIICDFCGTENLFSEKEHAAVECLNEACQNSLEGLEIIEITNDNNIPENVNIVGLKLIYQKTSEEITLKTNAKIILGRESYGSEVLGEIAQISRSHCSLEFVDNRFIVSDLNSTNGTFIGLGNDKISCTTAQVLNEKDFLVLGKEVFLVQFIKEKLSIEKANNKTQEPTEILCTECSCILEKLPCSCPDCGTWNE